MPLPIRPGYDKLLGLCAGYVRANDGKVVAVGMHHLHAVVTRGDPILIGDSGDEEEEGLGSEVQPGTRVESVHIGNTNCLEACVEKKWLNGAAN